MKKLHYRLIVSDFDGTLADRDCQVSAANKQAIEAYIEAGGVFAISSGRMPAAVLPKARELGLKGLLCCSQGTVILDIESGSVVFEDRFSMEATLDACHEMERMGLHILAFDLWECYSNQDNEGLLLYEKAAGCTVNRVTGRKLSDFLEEKKIRVYSLMALVSPQDSADVLAELKRVCPKECDATKSMDVLVEVVNGRYSKGSAVSYLAEHYGIPMERTVAIGDNHNDISMIECAGVGVAVRNADGALKEKADWVCEYTNEENAVAYIIRRFGFGEEG